jgi:hypothetical protein
MNESLKASSKISGLCLALCLSVGCQSSPDINDHWNASSTVPRITRAFLGYDSSRDGSYRDFAWERKASINLTLRRHLFNHNPDNPNHAVPSGTYAERPVNSLLPDPINFIHIEGLVLGLIPLAAGGIYFPLPVDSLVGILDVGDEGGEDGIDEFMGGVEQTFGNTIGVISTSFVQSWISPPMTGFVVRVNRFAVCYCNACEICLARDS